MTALRLPALGAALAVGIVVADRSGPGRAVSAATGAAAVIAFILAFRLSRAGINETEVGDLLPKVPARVIALVLIGGALTGFASMGFRINATSEALIPGHDGKRLRVTGKVISDPMPSGRAIAFNLRVDQAGDVAVRERVYVRMFGGSPPRLGDVVEAFLKIRELNRKNDFDLSLIRRGVVAKASVSGVGLRAIDYEPGLFLSLANRIRSEMQALARKALDRTEAGLVLGLTIGDDGLVPERLKEDFRTTSLSHLTAVSGTNVAIVLGATLIVLRSLRSSRRLQVIVGLAVILLFGAVTRWEPSVLRASIMAALALSAFLFGRLYDPRHGLSLAFIALLAYDPMLLWSVGFQLSFAATAGILLITPKLLQRLENLPRVLAEALAVALGAQLAVTPLLAFHFGRLSIVSIPANLAAFPLVAPITVLGFLGAVTGFVWQPAGMAIIELAGLFARSLGWVAHAFGSIPRGSIPIAHVGLGHLFVAYALVIAITLLIAGRKRAARWGFVAAVVVGTSLFWVGAGASAPPVGLRVTFFDVGQGDSALVESPAGARLLVDGGPDPLEMATELRGRRIRRVDLVVFSHAHFDHMNGLGAVMSSIDVRTAVHPGVPSSWIDRLPADDQPETTSEGDVYTIGDLTAEILGPSIEDREEATQESATGGSAKTGEGSALNDASVVMRVTWREACVLFTGDVEEPAQQGLTVSHRKGIDCAILKAPHHGSARLDPGFVGAVDPEWVAVSVGENTFGHPSRSALSLFERAGAQVLRTDRLGDVVLMIDAEGRVSVGATNMPV